MKACAEFAGALALCVPLGCSQDSGTGGQAIELEMQLVSSVAEGQRPGTFVTRTGYDVTLSEARIAAGPIYLYENPPPVASRPRGVGRAVWDWLVPSAQAHPGDQHFAGGTVLSEYLGQVVFDALSAEPLRLGKVPGVASRARSFSVWLEPPRTADAREALRGHHVHVVGEATRGDERYEFEGGLDIGAEGTLRRVEGLEMDAALRDGAQVTVELHLSRWFRDADFSTLEERAPSGRLLIGADSQVRTAWFIGARSFDSFSATID